MFKFISNLFHQVFDALAGHSRLAKRLTSDKELAIADAQRLRFLLEGLIVAFDTKEAQLKQSNRLAARTTNTKRVAEHLERMETLTFKKAGATS